MPALQRRWTAAEVRDLQEESRAWPRYELIQGELLVTPAPAMQHQLAVSELLFLLKGYARDHKVVDVLMSPADIELEPESVVQPDVFVFPPLAPSAHRSWKDISSLLLAVEVISPGSVRSDRLQKRDYYMRNGVGEYWIVDLEARHLERWVHGSAEAEILRISLSWQPAGAAAPLVIDLMKLFAEIG